MVLRRECADMNEQIIVKDVLEKAKQTGSVEELLALAKENGMELTQEEAEKYYAKFHQSGEVADDELDNVAGGGSSFRAAIPYDALRKR